MTVRLIEAGVIVVAGGVALLFAAVLAFCALALALDD
jgi:hypothetical protein